MQYYDIQETTEIDHRIIILKGKTTRDQFIVRIKISDYNQNKLAHDAFYYNNEGHFKFSVKDKLYEVRVETGSRLFELTSELVQINFMPHNYGIPMIVYCVINGMVLTEL
jgi:hypothetical protein